MARVYKSIKNAESAQINSIYLTGNLYYFLINFR